MKFDLPADDEELVRQVCDHIRANRSDDHGDMLLTMARKYRFAGYIGTIAHLFSEVESLQERVEYLERKRSWFTWLW